MSLDPCVFCDIIEGQAAASVVYADGRVMAFMDIQPVNPGHLLVVPRAHADSLASPSLYVRFAESIKGILYIILAVSIIAAVVLGQSGLIITLEDIIDNLILATLGKVLLAIIAVGLFIFGLKNLRMVK